MPSGTSTITVTTGTRRPICHTRSPCGALCAWNPQIPRSTVAPRLPVWRSLRTMA